jgi:hypothetical protein
MKQQSITSLPLSPEAERRNRMIKYSVTMGIRVVCIVLMLFVQGWWLLVCAIGAITLPYFAVVIANVHADPRGARVYRPGAIELSRGSEAGWDDAWRHAAGNDTAGNDTAGNDTARDDTVGSDAAGNGTAGNGAAGNGTAGNGAAGNAGDRDASRRDESRDADGSAA